MFFWIEPDAPTNFHLSNVTEDSALIIWSAPRAQVTGYRLFLTVEGSNPKQLRLPSRLTQYTLLNLQPDTPYTATLHSEKGNVLSEGATVTFRTCEFQPTHHWSHWWEWFEGHWCPGEDWFWSLLFLLSVCLIALPMRNAPRFTTDVTDTSIIISWNPVPRIGYKVHFRLFALCFTLHCAYTVYEFFPKTAVN